MTIKIDNIIIKDRLREDLGDLQELAIDIAENGLINPPTINQNYELLAGERRLRACQLLGWDEIEVRIMDTRDAEHDFEIEVSENEVRKAFTRTERDAIYERRLEARLKNGSPIGLSVNDAEREVSKELGTSRTNMQREKFIIDHKDAISEEEFRDWDEGRLSTNKAFQKVKAKLEQAQKHIHYLEQDNKRERKERSEALNKLHEVEEENKQLKKELKNEELNGGRDLHTKVWFLYIGIKDFLEKHSGYRYLAEEYGSFSKEDQRLFTRSISMIFDWANEMTNTTVSDVVITDSDALTPTVYNAENESIYGDVI